ncbi:MAG TPA: tetratricopeptide repeat protein [Rhodanobacteraceae bacterium]|nr:tetratricopeptide repeat protein [Rhodanobacteraceae bacterium]
MTTPFLVIAAIMVVAALACVLVPLLRSARREGRPRAPFVLALALVLVTPPVVLGAYLMVGTPQALQPLPTTPGHADLAGATEQLRASLAKKPDDAQGWALLAQAYSALNQPQPALDALNHLLKLKPDDPDAMVAWVEATAETSPTHQIGDASRAKLQRALQIEPNHQRALWLLGISDFQRGDYADAAKQWKTLLPMLQPGSKVAVAVQQELADAEARVGGDTPDAALAMADPAPASSAAIAPNTVALKVNVELDPKLAAKVQPADTLFVFARAVNGPPMPLAVARLKASDLPAKITLTDAMAMTPAMTLSKFAKVSIAARISKTGNAMPQAGDLESAPVEVATDSHAPVALTIDKVD